MLHVDDEGTLTIPSLGLSCRAQQMPRWLAADIATAIAITRDGEPDMPAPAAEHRRDSDRYIDITGAVLAEHTTPRTTDIIDGVTDGATTFLPGSTSSYLQVTATTADDVANLSPVVPAEVCEAVLHGDPSLDADLAAWRDPASQRAKLSLLGSVTVKAAGRPPVDQLFLYTEVVAYLALHPAGVTPDQFAHDVWPHKNYVGADSYPRRIVSAARTWLGTDPVTGQQYIPRAVGLVDRYSLAGALIDADLFVRLRARGQARGAAGVQDLRLALEFVTGVPLTGRRGGGWGWLQAAAEMGYIAAIVDVAHLVATHALATGDLELARTAAQTALRGGDVGDTGLLDMVAVCDAAGHRAEAASCVQQILEHHNAEVDEDLPPRTYDVLRRRQWLPVAM